jgi:predicted lipid-binding transport protein (Tim44 family)
MLRRSKIHLVLCGLAAAAILVLAVAEADAARRSGGGFGSRGNRTFTPPAATQTAPNPASPINRSVTQPQTQRPGTVGQAAQPGGMFGGRMGGFMGGMLAGFLGAGLLGMLFGGGLFGGLSGLSGFLGLLIQVALVVIVARLAWSWWQRRQQQQAPAYATAAGPALRNMSDDREPQAAYGGGSGAPMHGGGDTIEIGEADFNAFEKRLAEVQAAYSAEDIARLRRLATPEVVSYFAEELSDNASRGVVNTISDIKLLQGDLAEAWREGDTEYASVAMRYASLDYTAERDSGRLVEGDKQPFERTEIWTFRRSRGGEWMLSAVQQA